jgi:hypothetical protein
VAKPIPDNYRSERFDYPYGHRWDVAAHVKDIAEDEMLWRAVDTGGG